MIDISELPKVRFTIDPSNKKLGIKAMAIVADNAMETPLKYFSKANPKYQELKSENKEYKQVIHGLALRSEYPILRYDEFDQPYAGYFTSEDIEILRNQFHELGYTNQVNLNHDSDEFIKAYLITSYIVESNFQIEHLKSVGIEDAKQGDWYVQYRIEKKEDFERIINANYATVGFSIEAFLQEIIELNKNKKKEKNSMKKFFQKFKALLQEFETEEKAVFEKSKSDGIEYEYGAIDEPVSIISIAEDGSEKKEPAPNGVFKMENGDTVTVEAGVAKDIVKGEGEVIPEAEAKQEPKVETPAPVENLSKEPVKTEVKEGPKEEDQIEKLQKENLSKENKIKGLEKEINELKSKVEKLEKMSIIENPVIEPKKKVFSNVDFSKMTASELWDYKYGNQNQ